DDGVRARRVAAQDLLHLLGVDLLAAGVDRHRPPPKDDDRAVGCEAAVVAGYRVAHAADHRERARGLRRVLVVAERHVAGATDPADLFRAGLEEPGQVLPEHDGLLHREAARRRLLTGAARARTVRARLRR